MPSRSGTTMSRVSGPDSRAARTSLATARLAAALVLTLPGTPFLYYGEEIGMTDLLLDDASQFRDNWGLWLHRAAVGELGLSAAEAIDVAARHGRDKCRTPMQWSNAPNAGFSPEGSTTWLPVHPNHAEGVNVADQLDDAGSLLRFYRRLIRVRRSQPPSRVATARCSTRTIPTSSRTCVRLTGCHAWSCSTWPAASGPSGSICLAGPSACCARARSARRPRTRAPSFASPPTRSMSRPSSNPRDPLRDWYFIGSIGSR